MPLTPTTRTTTTLARGNALLFAASFAIVVTGLTTATKSPLWITAMSIGCLTFGWLLTATLIMHISSDRGPTCEPPDVQAEFHAMGRVPVSVRVQNSNSRWPLLSVTADIVMECDGYLLHSPPKFVGQLPVRSVAEFDWYLTPRRRGEHILRGLTLRTAFPGSLIVREFEFSVDRHLLALPAVYRLNPKMNELLAGKKRAAGHQPLNPAAMEEFVGVRQYRPGDNPRHVSLALSVRMPDYPLQLAVREFEDPADDEVCVVLDTCVPSANEMAGVLFSYRFEKSICFAIALCRQLCELKHRVRFMASIDGGEVLELRISHVARDIPPLERRLARMTPVSDPDSARRLLRSQARISDAILLFVSLQETFDSGVPLSDAVVITPEWQASLVAEVET